MRPNPKPPYVPNLLLVVLTLTPGLINTSAVQSIAPVIAADLHVPIWRVLGLPIYSDAALAFGCVLAAELSRRFEGRYLYLWLIAASTAVTIGSAAAPNYGVLFVVHMLHGLLAGMILIVGLPAVFTTFPKERVPITVVVFVICLFGATTLSPLVGGFLVHVHVWRPLFWNEAFLGCVALVLALLVLGERQPNARYAPIDTYALSMSALATALLYTGVGNLETHDWTYLPAAIPFGAGIIATIALLAGEAVRENPLLPVRALLRVLPVVGLAATASGGAIFTADQQIAGYLLTRVAQLDPFQAGVKLLPEFALAACGGVLFAIGLRTRWLPLFTLTGLVALALGSIVLRFVTVSDPRISAISLAMAIAALGAGLTVTPGLFIASLSVERKLVGGAIACVQLLRLTFSFITSPGVQHTIIVHSRSPEAMRVFLEQITRVSAAEHQRLIGPLLAGMTAAADFVIGGAMLAIAFVVTMLVYFHPRPQKPDLDAFFDEGRPAFDSPPLYARLSASGR
ncbi:MAG: MFS transporter [Vulcanimicrobiaceae bacterium]